MKVRQFEALRHVIARGTTKDAAHAMGLTQSAVSRLVTQLEDELGFRVFDRRQGRLHLTPEGQIFYGEAEKILTGLDQLNMMARDISNLSIGTLKVVAMPALSFGFLPEAVHRIQSRYRRLKISIDIAKRAEIEQDILRANHDIGLITLPIQNDSLDVEPLCSIECVSVLPPGHHLADREVICASDLADEPFVSIKAGTLFRYLTDELFGRLRIRRMLRLETESTVMICNLVAHGLGVSVVHRFIGEAFAGKVIVKPFKPAIRLEYGIVYPAGNELSTAAREFVETIRMTAADMTGGAASSVDLSGQLAARSTLGSSLSGNGTGSPRSADKSAAI